ncbi:MAG: UvrD-helicase domain-containing protein [Alistipes sp.]|nr:UvrD-helicase domain-containing protein [Alistipes sp.]
MNEDILQGLNPAQREAVTNFEGPSLIIAGAGSGKTRVLTTRIAWMLAHGVEPQSILALTFTNKAAREMRERIEKLVGPRARFIRMGTFHSVFARLLRENAERIGFPQSFTIYEPTDVKNVIKSIVKDFNLSEERYKPQNVAARISMAKNCLITPGAYIANATLGAEDRELKMPEVGAIYGEYCNRCKRNGAMDFDDLLLQTNILLRDAPDVLADYQEKFRYILVDEYQDTNMAQYIIVRRLALKHSNVCVVGDDAQSIYAFRGAKIENILSFQRDYPTTKVYKLEQNYRSTQTIVDAANSLIKHNSRRLEKKCFSAADHGEKIRLVRVLEDHYEPMEVAMDIKDRARDGAEWRDFAILYRTNKQHGLFEAALTRRGIPYRVYKGMSLLEHKDIRNLLAYISLIINPNDDESFKRIINYPARGIGDTTIARIEQIAKERGTSMWQAIDELTRSTEVNAVEKVVVKKVSDFVTLINTLSLERSKLTITDFGKEVLARSGIMHLLESEQKVENETSKDYLEQVLAMMSSYEDECHRDMEEGLREEGDEPTIDEWMQNIMLQTDQDNDDDGNKVTLMTIHSAKGLEYDYIYIAGMEEGLFPSSRSVESLESIEEERRLMYVAITRAKKAAMLSFSETRRVWGKTENTQPSRFLKEIDTEYLDANFDIEELHGRNRWERMVEDRPQREKPSFEALRNRYDIRRGGQYSNRPAADRPKQSPNPDIITTPAPLDPRRAGMRSVGVRASESTTNGSASTPSTLGACAYKVGDRVSHPKFESGIIERIEPLSTDYKLVVKFDKFGSKTLLAKFAKLTKE